MSNIINQGTGAGGAKTNKNGKNYEAQIYNKIFLINNYNFEEKTFTINTKNIYHYLFKEYSDKKIIYLQQKTFNQYLLYKYNISSLRIPDEAYLIIYNTGKIILYINEIKNQNVDGSVELKLWSAPSLQKEYQIYLNNKFNNITIKYTLTVNQFLQKKFEDKKNIKYNILQQILDENYIKVFYGDEEDYYNKLNEFIQNL